MRNNFTFDENKYSCDFCFGEPAFLANNYISTSANLFPTMAALKICLAGLQENKFSIKMQFCHLCRNLTPPVMLNLKWVLIGAHIFHLSCLGVAPMERMGIVAICEGAPTSPSWRTSISCDGELGAAPESWNQVLHQVLQIHLRQAVHLRKTRLSTSSRFVIWWPWIGILFT